MFDLAGEDVCDGLDAAMRVPWEAGAIVVRVLVAKVVEEQKRIELVRLAEPERALQLHARAFDVRLGMVDALHGPDRHVVLL